MTNQRRTRGGRKANNRKTQRNKIILTIAVLALIVGGIFVARQIEKNNQVAEANAIDGDEVPGRPELDVDLLTVNEYSRPGIALNQVNGIVMHYTANPGSTAKRNRDYFENLQNTHTTKASSHFIVGLEGEIVQCIPTAEIAYASNDRNSDTIAIECCHPDETGEFNEATYDSMVHLVAWLCKKFDLTSEQVIRHYDITGKDCPKYFVENPEAWETFKTRVAEKIEEL